MNKLIASLSVLAAVSLTADECIDSCECCEGPCSGLISLRHREANGIGYSPGYTSIDLFYTPDIASESWYPYFDLRGHVFNNGKPAFNAGIGVRYLADCYDFVTGANLFYDYKEARHANFHQIGVGFEALWPYWDLRLNGYFPVSTTKKNYRTGFLEFRGNTPIVFNKTEFAFWGGDITLGYWLYQCDWLGIHTALAGYYFDGKFGEHAGGGLFRTKVDICKYIRLEGQVSYDNRFKWLGQGELSLNFAFGPTVRRYSRKISCCPDLIALENRLVEQPERFEMIVTGTHEEQSIAVNSFTGQPLSFLFVSNASSGDGTFEQPFSTLADAEIASNPGDVIYLFPGDGSTTGMDTGIVLKDGQILTSSRVPTLLASPFGPVTIPQTTDVAPRITNTVGTTVVTPTNDNVITGLRIEHPAGDGIATADPVQNLSILLNDIDASGLAVDITKARANFNLEENTTRGDISVTSDQAATANFHIVKNSSESNYFIFSAFDSLLNATVENNIILNHDIFIGNESGDMVLSFRANQLDQLSGATAFTSVTNTDGNLQANIHDNLITRPAGNISDPLLKIVNDSGESLFDLAGNQVNLAGQQGRILLDNAADTMKVFSPNLDVTGVEAINNADVEENGVITYVN